MTNKRANAIAMNIHDTLDRPFDILSVVVPIKHNRVAIKVVETHADEVKQIMAVNYESCKFVSERYVGGVATLTYTC